MNTRIPARPRPAAFVAIGLALSLANILPAAAASRVVLPVGTVIPVRLDNALSSKVSRPGDRFTATVRYGRDDAGLPSGTRLEGVVREALRSRSDKPGVLDLDFRRAVFPDGEARTLDGGIIDLASKSITRTSSGRLVASSDKSQDRLKFIGYGAGAGLIIGALTKGDVLLDTVLGAGLGYLYNEYANKPKARDVEIKRGTEFGVRLDRSFAFYNDRRTSAASRSARPGAPVPVGYRSGEVTDRRPAAAPDFDRDREQTDIGVLVDDRNVTFGRERPFAKGDTVMVPVGPVARAGNFDYGYDSQERMVRARAGSVRLALDSRIAVVDGERRRLPAAAELIGGTVYVPMEFLGMAAGGSVYYDEPSRTVVVTTRDEDTRQ